MTEIRVRVPLPKYIHVDNIVNDMFISCQDEYEKGIQFIFSLLFSMTFKYACECSQV